MQRAHRRGPAQWTRAYRLGLCEMAGQLVVDALALVVQRVVEGPADAVPKREVFPVVARELEVVVRVVCRAVDDCLQALGHPVVAWEDRRLGGVCVCV